MKLDLKEIEENINKVSDIYAERFDIKRDKDWYFYKFIEEVGEMTKAYNLLNGKSKNDPDENSFKDFQDEFSDVFAHLILFAKENGIDPLKSLKEKWFLHLNN